MNDLLQSVLDSLDDRFKKYIKEKLIDRGDCIVRIDKDSIYSVMEFLKPTFDFLIDITAIDTSELKLSGKSEGFDIVYQLYSTLKNIRLRIKSYINKDQKVRSVSGLWKSAISLEREVYDMFGIEFFDHPCLERILLPENFESHPLRKGYPLKGIGERDHFPRVERAD
ncbi:MAG: NADH-quinone oxidoreductase subunit C [Candidatus Hydrogenedentota bacterium]